MKKPSFSAVLTGIVCAVLVIGAICIGVTKGWSNERSDILVACMERHNDTSGSVVAQVAQCHEEMEDFDHRLSTKWTGRLAGCFGIEPIADSVEPMHERLVRNSAPEKDVPALHERVADLLDNHIDTSLSVGKVFWTLILLSVIFGKGSRKRGLSLGKLLAGFGLFKLWKRD